MENIIINNGSVTIDFGLSEIFDSSDGSNRNISESNPQANILKCIHIAISG